VPEKETGKGELRSIELREDGYLRGVLWGIAHRGKGGNPDWQDGNESDYYDQSVKAEAAGDQRYGLLSCKRKPSLAEAGTCFLQCWVKQ
jgi:hypothetical protein